MNSRPYDEALLRELAAFYNGIDQPRGFDATFISGDFRKLPASFQDALKAMGMEPLAKRLAKRFRGG
jgi:hypothetical protein